MHGIIWLHALPCMKSYDSMRGIACKVCRSGFHAWNRMESYGHMRPCMELHGSLMNLDPGGYDARTGNTLRIAFSS